MNGMSQAQIEPWRLRRIGLSHDSGRMAADFYWINGRISSFGLARQIYAGYDVESNFCK